MNAHARATRSIGGVVAVTAVVAAAAVIGVSGAEYGTDGQAQAQQSGPLAAGALPGRLPGRRHQRHVVLDRLGRSRTTASGGAASGRDTAARRDRRIQLGASPGCSPERVREPVSRARLVPRRFALLVPLALLAGCGGDESPQRSGYAGSSSDRRGDARRAVSCAERRIPVHRVDDRRPGGGHVDHRHRSGPVPSRSRRQAS